MLAEAEWWSRIRWKMRKPVLVETLDNLLNMVIVWKIYSFWLSRSALLNLVLSPTPTYVQCYPLIISWFSKTKRAGLIHRSCFSRCGCLELMPSSFLVSSVTSTSTIYNNYVSGISGIKIILLVGLEFRIWYTYINNCYWVFIFARRSVWFVFITFKFFIIIRLTLSISLLQSEAQSVFLHKCHQQLCLILWATFVEENTTCKQQAQNRNITRF